MNNSKLILGVLTLALGVAGAVSSMASTRVANARVWFTTVNQGKVCTLVTASICPINAGTFCRTGFGHTLYTRASLCLTPFLRAK